MRWDTATTVTVRRDAPPAQMSIRVFIVVQRRSILMDSARIRVLMVIKSKMESSRRMGSCILIRHAKQTMT
jgi:hypothetical protein